MRAKEAELGTLHCETCEDGEYSQEGCSMYEAVKMVWGSL